MKVLRMEQKSPEWWDYKAAKVSGTRFGQLISDTKNRLIFELMNEKLDGYIQVDEFINESMQYGIDGEPIAIKLVESQRDVNFEIVGIIESDYSKIHMASPDGLDIEQGIVAEVKSTMDGSLHLERIFNGFESKHMPQCINYFACSDEVNEVWLISYCGFREERPIFIQKLTRESLVKIGRKSMTIGEAVKIGRERLIELEKDLNEKIETYKF